MDKVITQDKIDIEIKLDKTIMNFLERRELESQTLEFSKASIGYNKDIDFIQIASITYDKENKDTDISLIDFQQLLSAVSSQGGSFVYLIDSNSNGIKIYLGSMKGEHLQNAFQGIYSGSDVTLSQPKLKNLKQSKAMLGIPSLKRDSDKNFKQSLEKIIFPLQGKRFRIILIAESYQPVELQEIINNFRLLGNGIHKLSHFSRNVQSGITDTKALAETIGTTITKGKTLGKTVTTTDGKTEGSTEGYSKKPILGGLFSLGTAAAGATGGFIIGSSVGGSVGATVGTIGGIGGTFPGIMAGGAVGTTFGPIGTVIGAIAGGIIPIATGAIAGGTAGSLTGGIAGAGVGLTAGGMLGSITNNFGKTYTKSKQTSTTKSTAIGVNESENVNIAKNEQINVTDSKAESKTIGVTFDEIDKNAEYCESMVDKYIERFQIGLNSGMWNTALYIQADDSNILEEVQHTLKSVYSGVDTFYEPIRFTNNLPELNFKNFPLIFFKPQYFPHHPIHPSFLGFTTAINTEELSLLSVLPRNDLDGVSVSSISNFGLNQNVNGKNIEIGNILCKKKKTSQRLKISLESLNEHTFVCGITGCGKSTTVRNILLKLYNDFKIPFLVIEPVKSEYKNLLNVIENIQVFSPGKKNDIFKFNPFVFDYNKSSSSNLMRHIDSVKTSFNAAFPMYAAMPYILEDAIHRIYEEKGWNIETLEHPAFDHASDKYNNKENDFNLALFPTMSDLLGKIDQVVEEAGYFIEQSRNFKAALKTRIRNLTIGNKGKIFNSRHCINNDLLFNSPSVIDLSNIIDDSEKSFLMGLILNKLYRYREMQGSSNTLKHILVIEEAHRLLPNIPLETNLEVSNSKGAAVESFINILAEVRAYGQGIIIADQIPTKLHSDVIKNTNIKIIHRNVAIDDRQIVGSTANLNIEQIEDIGNLKTGEAIIHNKDLHQAFMSKIDIDYLTKIDDQCVIEQQTKLLNQYPLYKYEYQNEEEFYIQDYIKYLSIDSLSVETNTINFLKVLTAASLLNINDTKNYWDNFCSNLDFIGLTEKALMAKLFIYYSWQFFEKKLCFISDMRYYKGIWQFDDMKANFNKLIISLSNGECNADILEDFANSFMNLKLNRNIFPSMKHYPRDKINYVLFILEYIKWTMYKPENFTTKEMLNDALNAFLNETFNYSSYELKYAFLACRYGKKENSQIDALLTL